MRKRTVFVLGGLVGVVVGVVIYASYLQVTRPRTAPANVALVYPWGSMDVGDDQSEEDSDVERSLRQSFRSEPFGEFDKDQDGVGCEG